jgi:hypothetical protein
VLWPATSIVHHANRVRENRIWSIGDRIDWFADDTDTLVRWREHDHGRLVRPVTSRSSTSTTRSMPSR